MLSFTEISNLFEDHVAKCELDNEPKELYLPIKYILEDRGKRMRPLLMLLACDAYSGSVERCLDAAFGIETFHNFTLLHDDIMDKAPIRRGRETVHVKWNDNVAILSGDAMVILAYALFSKVEQKYLPKVLEVFNKAAIEVCEGQQFDMNFENSKDVTIDQYINMIRLKTSVLLAAALEIGALVGGATEQQQKALYNFGINLGLAFQIQDDILDTYGDGATFGKNIGGDIAVGKKTFLYLSAYNKASKEEKEILENSFDFETVKAVYDCLEVKEIALNAVQSYYDKSMEWLTKAGREDQTVKLKSYAETLLNRNK